MINFIHHTTFVNVNHLKTSWLSGKVGMRRQVKAHRGSSFRLPQILSNFNHKIIEILLSICILNFVNWKMNFIAFFSIEVIEFVMFRNLVIYLPTQHQSSLVGPAAGYILYSVASASKQDHWYSKTFHVIEAFSMSLYGQVQVAQFIFGERVSSTLDNDNVWDKACHYLKHYSFEKMNVGGIIHTSMQGNIYGIILAQSLSDRLQRTSSGKEILAVFVKTDSHDTICIVEGLLHSISMMHIDVQVKNTRVDFEQFQDAEDDVVDIAETTCFSFFAMMEASCPINYQISLARYYQVSCVYTAASCQFTEIKQSLESWAVKALIDFEDRTKFLVQFDSDSILFFHKRVLLNDCFGSGRNPSLQVFDVEGVMKGAHFFRSGNFRMIHFEARGEIIVVDKTVNHFDTFWLHRMLLAELIIGDVLIVEVANFAHLKY